MTLPDAVLPMVEEAADAWLLAGECTARDLAVRVVGVCRREGVELRVPRRRKPAVPPPDPAPQPEPVPVSPLTPKPGALPDDARRLAARSETP